MTTIAAWGREIAGDTLVTNNGCRVGYVSKIVYFEEQGHYIGASGSMRIVDVLHEMSRNGEVWETWREFSELFRKRLGSDEVDGSLIAVDGSNVWTADSNLNWVRAVEGRSAIGSGSEIAVGALYGGVGVVDAVEIACMIDVYSGGEIEYFIL